MKKSTSQRKVEIVACIEQEFDEDGVHYYAGGNHFWNFDGWCGKCGHYSNEKDKTEITLPAPKRKKIKK